MDNKPMIMLEHYGLINHISKRFLAGVVQSIFLGTFDHVVWWSL